MIRLRMQLTEEVCQFAMDTISGSDCMADLKGNFVVRRALEEYETFQLKHTTSQVHRAYVLGRPFHHLPFPLTYLRDLVLDWTNSSF